MIQFSIDTSDFQRVAERLARMQRDMPEIVTEGINKALVVGQAEASRAIIARYNVSSAPVEAKMASTGNMKGELRASGGMKPVSEFAPMETGNRSVSVSIIRGSRKIIRGAFMVGGRVMERRQPSRYPIFPVSTIGIPGMLGSKAVSIPVEKLMVKTTEEFIRGAMQ